MTADRRRTIEAHARSKWFPRLDDQAEGELDLNAVAEFAASVVSADRRTDWFIERALRQSIIGMPVMNRESAQAPSEVHA